MSGAKSVSGPSTLSDPLLHAVFVTAMGATALSFALLVVIALLRLRFVAHERRLRSLTDRWRPLFARAVAGDDVRDAPDLAAAERELVLPLWNELRESVRGEAATRLDAIARQVGLDRTARALIDSGNARKRLLAINTAGHLLAPDVWDKLTRDCRDADAIVSMAAVRALLRADSTRALPELVPLMIAREDWSLTRLVPILRNADAASLGRALENALPLAEDRQLQRLLALAEVLPHDRTAPWARRILAERGNESVVAAALRLVHDPRDAPLVHRYLAHPSWQIRVRAVAALEQVADTEDLPRLVKALSDAEWWVRFRAARALTRLPFFDRVQLARLRDSVSDRFARDALTHALAEERPQ